MDKEIKDTKINEEELENVNGGLEQAGNLLFTGKEIKTTTNTIFSGKKKKAGNLLYTDKNKGVDGKLISGDVTDKGTFC